MKAFSGGAIDSEKLNDVNREIAKLTRVIGLLEKRMDKQSQVIRALFEVLKDEHHVDTDKLMGKLAEIVRQKAADLERECAKCNRRLGDKRKCMYCGEELKVESVFDLL